MCTLNLSYKREKALESKAIRISKSKIILEILKEKILETRIKEN